MKTHEAYGRREFLKAAGGAFGLLPVTSSASFSLAQTRENSLSRGKAPSAKVWKLLNEMETKGYSFWSVPGKDAELLHFMVKATRARNLLEIGTSHGFSAIWMGLAIEETDGRLTTIEIDKERYDLARNHISEAGLSHRVTCLKGDAHHEIVKLEGPFDFVFLDADKEGQMDYFNKLYPKRLPPGGILSVHNAIRQADSMRNYLAMIMKHRDFDTVTLSATLDDGFCFSYRHRR
jgi:predicted O-methyltransferase YrrM